MGNPIRFIGAGAPIDLEEDQSIPGRCAVVATFRTHDQQFLMRPSTEVNEILLGCLGRAHDRYPEMPIHAVTFLSNHGDLILSPPSPFVMWSFMRDFMSTAATRINGHHNRDGTFLERRYRAIPILDEAAFDERFAYVLLQGTKENLVGSAREWPGVSSVRTLMGGPKLIGRWRDRSRDYELRRQRERKLARAAARDKQLELPQVKEVWLEYPIELSPPPHWQHLSVGQRRARVADLVRNDEAATRSRHERDGTRPLGPAAVLTTNPFASPRVSKKSPAPICHTTSPVLRRGFRAARKELVAQLRKATAALEPQLVPAGVPVGASTPPLCPRPERPPHGSLAEPVMILRAPSSRAGPATTR